MYTKIYLREDLLCSETILKHRLVRLCNLYRYGDCFPKISVFYDGNRLKISLERMDGVLKQYDALDLKWINGVKKGLASSKIWHGDIKPQNIGYVGDRHVLIDWEPALKQIRHNMPQLITGYSNKMNASEIDLHNEDLLQLSILENNYGI